MSDSVIKKVIADIEQFGWHIIKVPEDNEGPGFAYSVGLFKSYQHPEIIIFGLPIETMHKILNNIGIQIKSGTNIQHNSLHSGILKAGFTVKFRNVSLEGKEFLGMATKYYMHNFEALQLLWPDKSNVLPDSENCDSLVKNKQPKCYI